MVSNPKPNHLSCRPTHDLTFSANRDPLIPMQPPLPVKSLPKFKHHVPWHRRRYVVLVVLVLSSWSLLTFESFFLWWLRWSLTGGPASPDPSLLNDCPARNYSLPLVVVIPLISTQLNRLQWNLERWVRPQLHPCSFKSTDRKPHLYFFFDRPLTHPATEEAAHGIRQLVNQPTYSSVLTNCFASVSITSANLTRSQTRNSYSMDIIHNLMQTGGSNRFFEKAFSTFGGGRFRHMLWMEPDAYPIRRNWLNAVVEESTWGDFWVRGSFTRQAPKFNIGLEPFRSRYQRHLNGNAIYALDDRCFTRYRQLTREKYGDGAFDVAMNLYLRGMQQIMTFQMVGHRFQATRVIADLGVSKLEIDQLPSMFPGTFLIHGKAKFVRFPGINFMQY